MADHYVVEFNDPNDFSVSNFNEITAFYHGVENITVDENNVIHVVLSNGDENTYTSISEALTSLDALKAPINNPTFTGSPKAPTPANTSNDTSIATTAFVNTRFKSLDAMIFKGTIGVGGTVTSLPANHEAGWTYKVVTAGTYADHVCEVGDLILCVKDRTKANNADWTTVQNNDGSVSYTDQNDATVNGVAIYQSTSGKFIQNSSLIVHPLENSLSLGRKSDTTIGTGSVAIGLDVEASGAYSHAEGKNTIASGQAAHAEGSFLISIGSEPSTIYSTASGSFSHSEGSGAIASGSSSHAEGAKTTASGDSSHAEGYSTTASGEVSHAEGYNSLARGYYSHSEGKNTTASGVNSHAEGLNTIANHKSQHASGEFNVQDSSSAIATSRGNYVEIVGNGTADDVRSNARTLDWNGNERLKGDLYVGCNADSTGGTKVATTTDVSAKADKTDTVFTSTLSRGRKADTEAGLSSIAFGYNAEASKNYCTAIGNSATAKGNNATAIGEYTIASGDGSFVIGKYNVEDAPFPEWTANTHYDVGNGVQVIEYIDPEIYAIKIYRCTTENTDNTFTQAHWEDITPRLIDSKYAEIVGNGKYNARSNARALDWDGNERLMGDLYVGCNADSSGGTKVANTQEVNAAITEVSEKKAPAIQETINTPAEIQTFTDGADNLPMGMTVGMEPVQDLHGYEYPWVGGAGNNIMPIPLTYGRYINSETGDTSSATNQKYCYTDYIPVNPGDVLFFGQNDSTASVAGLAFYSTNAVSGYISGMTWSQLASKSNVVTVPEGAYFLRHSFNKEFNPNPETECYITLNSNPHVWSPYENICPISGWTGANVTVSPTSSQDDPDKEVYSITFPNPPGTVYGGELSILQDGTGVLTSVYSILDMGDYDWTKYVDDWHPDNFVFLADINRTDMLLTNTITTKSSMFRGTGNRPISSFSAMQDNNVAFCTSGVYKRYLMVRCDEFDTATDFKTAVTGQTVIYQLAEPTPITLTAEQVGKIMSLKGLNNVWVSGAGQTIDGLEYVADTKMYIDNLFATIIPAEGVSF